MVRNTNKNTTIQKERSLSSIVTMAPNVGPESNFEGSLPQPVNVISYCVSP